MIYYIFTLMVPLFMASIDKGDNQKKILNMSWILFFVYMVVFMGLRERVGMDWNNYLIHFSRVEAQNWGDLFGYSEWLYYLTMFISKELGFGIYGSNTIVAFVFFFGLFSFCRNLPNPWLGLMASMPILIFTFAISANRQAMAAGVLLYLYANWHVFSANRKIFFIVVASLCHASAIFVGLFFLFDKKLKKTIRFLIALLVIAYLTTAEQSVERFEYYGDLYGGVLAGQDRETVESKGAFAHILANAGPALFILYSYFKKGWAYRLNPIYIQMSALVIALFILSFFTSTAAARISMYLFPVSLIFFSTSSLWIGKSSEKMFTLISGVFFILLSVFWFNFSNSGFAFVNYKNIIFL